MSHRVIRSNFNAVLSWTEDALPYRIVRGFAIDCASRQGLPQGMDAPRSWQAGNANNRNDRRFFDFSGHIRRLCEDVAQRSPELGHIDAQRVLIGITQARSLTRHGLQARLTPLRFYRGSLERHSGQTLYRVQRYRVGGVEMLYLLTFCLPRFLEQTFDEKLITLFHELYHIAPGFLGDLRRLEGRCTLHSRSKRAYDAHMARLARAYLASGASPALYDFLRLNHAEMTRRYGAVMGLVVPRPRLLPVEAHDE